MPLDAFDPAPKSLEYKLIDLLALDSIDEAETDAIWTLVRFLKRKKNEAPDEFAALLR